MRSLSARKRRSAFVAEIPHFEKPTQLDAAKDENDAGDDVSLLSDDVNSVCNANVSSCLNLAEGAKAAHKRRLKKESESAPP